MSEGSGLNLGLFPSRNALFWLHSHLACFGEKWWFEEVGSWDLCCHLTDKEPEVQAGAWGSHTISSWQKQDQTPESQPRDWLGFSLHPAISPDRFPDIDQTPAAELWEMLPVVSLWKLWIIMHALGQCKSLEFAIWNFLLSQGKSWFLYVCGLWHISNWTVGRDRLREKSSDHRRFMVVVLLRELREGKPGFCPFQTLGVGVIWGSLNQFIFSHINCRKRQTG